MSEKNHFFLLFLLLGFLSVQTYNSSGFARGDFFFGGGVFPFGIRAHTTHTGGRRQWPAVSPSAMTRDSHGRERELEEGIYSVAKRSRRNLGLSGRDNDNVFIMGVPFVYIKKIRASEKDKVFPEIFQRNPRTSSPFCPLRALG